MCFVVASALCISIDAVRLRRTSNYQRELQGAFALPSSTEQQQQQQQQQQSPQQQQASSSAPSDNSIDVADTSAFDSIVDDAGEADGGAQSGDRNAIAKTQNRYQQKSREAEALSNKLYIGVKSIAGTTAELARKIVNGDDESLGRSSSRLRAQIEDLVELEKSLDESRRVVEQVSACVLVPTVVVFVLCFRSVLSLSTSSPLTRP